jgi:hypothetical protein
MLPKGGKNRMECRTIRQFQLLFFPKAFWIHKKAGLLTCSDVNVFPFNNSDFMLRSLVNLQQRELFRIFTVFPFNRRF